jgi:hypothetical protein
MMEINAKTILDIAAHFYMSQSLFQSIPSDARIRQWSRFEMRFCFEMGGLFRNNSAVLKQ